MDLNDLVEITADSGLSTHLNGEVGTIVRVDLFPNQGKAWYLVKFEGEIAEYFPDLPGLNSPEGCMWFEGTQLSLRSKAPRE